MKVKDLISSLSSLNPELEVILQKDAEGNSYSPYANYWLGVYRPEKTWSGYMLDETEDEMEDNDVYAIVLVPTN